ncbi:MAG: TetR/AcrR family transcriptional regulator [Chloroflexota bacterium]|nr:TetR/AcrR family transcriptional regulator [Chloroflexota bacterium]
MTTRAKRRPAQQRKRLILETAQAVFAASNYTKVGTAELAKAAGISEPALYRYFSSKKELFISTLEATAARLLDIWERIASEVVDPLEIIRAIGLGYYDHLRSRSPVIKLLFQAISEADDEDIRQTLHDNFASFIRFLEETITEGKRRGLIRPDVDTTVAAWQFMATGLALDVIHLLGFDEEIDRRSVEDWGRLYLESIREKPIGADKPEGRLAAGGTVPLWESPRQGLP